MIGQDENRHVRPIDATMCTCECTTAANVSVSVHNRRGTFRMNSVRTDNTLVLCHFFPDYQTRACVTVFLLEAVGTASPAGKHYENIIDFYKCVFVYLRIPQKLKKKLNLKPSMRTRSSLKYVE